MRTRRPLPTQDRLKEVFTYDPETGIFTRRITQGRCGRWKAGTVCGTAAGGYVSINVDYIIYRAHRLAWRYMTGDSPDGIDHINGDGMDNRFCNLRPANQTQNAGNKRIQKNNKSGYKGVFLHKQTGKYRARLQRYGKLYELGIYNTAEEAKAAYDAAAKIIHGEFFRS